METIGIRAITERGRLIARIVPIDPDKDLRATLIASGALAPASEPWPDIDVDRLESGDISTFLDELPEDR